MKKGLGINHIRKNWGQSSLQLLWSYLVIVLAPAIAVFVIYSTMQDVLLDVQREKAINLQAESVCTLDRELDQIVHVLIRIAEDDSVKYYMEDMTMLSGEDSYYAGYRLGVNLTNYYITNQLIKNIYIFLREGSYISQMPMVIPNTRRGIDTTSVLNENQDYSVLIEELNMRKETSTEGVLYLENSDGYSSILMFREVVSENSKERLGYVMVELDHGVVINLISQPLSDDSGAGFLTDADGKLILVYDNLGGDDTISPSGMTWEEYIWEKGWEENSFTFVSRNLDYNQWQLISAVPNAAMVERIGDFRYFIMSLCVLSILTGIAICMKYWRSSWSVVKKYEKIQEKLKTGDMSGGIDGVWKRFGGIIDQMEELQKTVERQAEWARAEILRKILYGTYDTAEEIWDECRKTRIAIPVELPCLIAVVKVRAPMEQEISITEEEIGVRLKEHIGKILPYKYRMINTESFTYVLVLQEQMDSRSAKEIFEKINYAFYSRIPLNIYMGISGAAGDVMEINTEYENACTCCEYASYYKIRIPLISDEILERGHMVFTVEMEIQVEKAIRNGSREQLEQFMDKIQEIFWQRGRQRRHNIELVRCIALRCLDEEPDTKEKRQLQERIRCMDKFDCLKESIFDVCSYFEWWRSQSDGEEQIRLKAKLEEKIIAEYPRQDLNLAYLADWAGISQKKLYRDFKTMFGVSFSSYLEMLRLRQSKKMLQEGRLVQEVAAAVGYNSDYSFRRAFKRVVGVSPGNYQKLQ